MLCAGKPRASECVRVLYRAVLSGYAHVRHARRASPREARGTFETVGANVHSRHTLARNVDTVVFPAGSMDLDSCS